MLPLDDHREGACGYVWCHKFKRPAAGRTAPILHVSELTTTSIMAIGHVEDLRTRKLLINYGWQGRILWHFRRTTKVNFIAKFQRYCYLAHKVDLRKTPQVSVFQSQRRSSSNDIKHRSRYISMVARSGHTISLERDKTQLRRWVWRPFDFKLTTMCMLLEVALTTQVHTTTIQWW